MAFQSIATCLLVASALASASPKTIPDSELAIRGVSLSMTLAQSLAILGKPHRMYTHPHAADQTILEYPGLEVVLVDGEVESLQSTSKLACTPAGVCPGMPLQSVYRTYGKSPLVEQDGRMVVEYYPKISDCWLEISVLAGRVSMIHAQCQV